MSNAQRNALAMHRRRRRDRGVVRLEVQVPAHDAKMMRQLAAALRDRPEIAQSVREQVQAAMATPKRMSALDLFGSDLPDSYFDGVFDHPRTDQPREIDL